jgi:hypothetical protein
VLEPELRAAPAAEPAPAVAASTES